MTNDPNSPETVATFFNEVQATALVAALSDTGIQATTTGGYTAGFRAEAPGGISVIVRQSDFERAREVLKQFESDGDFDWSQVDVGQPQD